MAKPLFFFNDTATTEIYTLSLHDALPISQIQRAIAGGRCWPHASSRKLVAQRTGSHVRHELAKRHDQPSLRDLRSEEHTSELQSPCNLVCRLLLEKQRNS